MSWPWPTNPFPPLLSPLPSAARASQREANPHKFPQPLLAPASDSAWPLSHHPPSVPECHSQWTPTLPQAPPLYFLHGTSPPHMLCNFLFLMSPSVPFWTWLWRAGVSPGGMESLSGPIPTLTPTLDTGRTARVEEQEPGCGAGAGWGAAWELGEGGSQSGMGGVRLHV